MPAIKLNVLLLIGGQSSEAAVSLSTGKMIAKALASKHHNIIPVEINASGQWLRLDAASTAKLTGSQPERMDRSQANKPLALSGPHDIAHLPEPIDIVFIALHGGLGENGGLQGSLELLGLPYTGSGIIASALGMDKLRSRTIFQANGIEVPKTLTVEPRMLQREREKVLGDVAENIGFPCVVKPNDNGSSVGINIVDSPDALSAALDSAAQYSRHVLVEEYIAGTEVTVGVLEKEDGEPFALPAIEIVPNSRWFDYQSKYEKERAQEIIPARIASAHERQAREYALRAHALLGCEGLSRSDMIIRGDKIYLLEVNTLPGMTETSLYPQAARAVGIDFPTLLENLIESGLRRAELTKR